MVLLFACKSKQTVDLIVYNGKIYTLINDSSVVEALAVKDGKIFAIGSTQDIKNSFEANEWVDLNQQFVYPGFNDAHCHFYGLGLFATQVDLTNCTSVSQMVDTCIKFYALHGGNILYGRGWDQTKFTNGEFPGNEELNHAFADIPVILKRVDGHAALANDYALKLAGFTPETKIFGGSLNIKNNKLTGLLIDNAVDSLEKVLPEPTDASIINALKTAEQLCLNYGITSLTDAGLSVRVVNLIDSLQKASELKIRVNAMLSISNESINWLNANGGIKTDRLQVNSFKMYADGALGSRGACLLNDYSDMPGNKGFLLTSQNQMEKYIQQLASTKFQLNTHCIGDSANRLILDLYGKYLPNKFRRWRIEHAQVVDSSDIHKFARFGIIPSVQPTHATSDMRWAESRLGSNRVKNAYVYKTLLNQNGWIPLGTDFPVEDISPFYTFFSAVERKDANGNPVNGFQASEAITRLDAIKGITLWPATAAFEEHEKGSLEPGKYADFVVLSANLLSDSSILLRKLQPASVYLNGTRVK